MTPMTTNWKLFEDYHTSPDDLPWLGWLRRTQPAKHRDASAAAVSGAAASGGSASRPPAGAGLAR
jgi:hypothetical protein